MPAPSSLALVLTVTAIELAAAVSVAHQLVRRPMRARGLPRWTVGDTILTSPLFFIATTLFLGGLNGGILAVASASDRAVPWIAVALAGAIAGAFGVRAFGKLH